MLDLGTGLRYFGRTQPHDGTFSATALLSHLHWDHLQGLPFLTPLLVKGSILNVVAPIQDDGRSLEKAIIDAISPPTFPVEITQLPGTLTYRESGDETFNIGGFEVISRFVPHVGPTLGFRIQWRDKVIVYIPDHQQPFDGSLDLTDGARELMDGADLLIHDAQYLPEEFARRSQWGHCTTEFAVQAARQSRVKHLVLFHHDPARTDDTLDRVSAALGAETGNSIRLTTAHEGLIIHV